MPKYWYKVVIDELSDSSHKGTETRDGSSWASVRPHPWPVNQGNLSKALGHRNTVITERHYLKWVPKLQEQLAEHIFRTWSTEQQGMMELEQFAEVPVAAPLQ
jgi:hypothetical protein